MENVGAVYTPPHIYVVPNGNNVSSDGTRLMAGINGPGSIFLAENGTMYISGRRTGRVRKISTQGNVTTIGEAIDFHALYGQPVVDKQENIYVSMAGKSQLKKISAAGKESILAGSGFIGDEQGSGKLARFRNPEGLCCLDANGQLQFFVCDSGNRKIKKIVHL